MVQNERALEQFQTVYKDVVEKFKKSNIKSVLISVLELIKQIVKTLDKSQVLDDCIAQIEKFKIQIEKVKILAKKAKGGDKSCLEVIQQKKEIEELIMNINQERVSMENSLNELQKLNSQDLQVSLGDQTEQDTLKQRLLYSIIELIKEKNAPLATLLAPEGIKSFQIDPQQQNQSIQSQGFELNSIFAKSASSFVEMNQSNAFNSVSKQQNPNSFQLTEELIQQAHQDFINSVIEVSDDYYATASSDFKVNLWSKQSFNLIESFNLEGEVVSMCKAANEMLVCGMINGTMGIIDIGNLRVKQIYRKSHTGTVIACIALRSTGRQIIISQDDSREIKVWNLDDLSTPLIKTIGRSYNPVWYVQSLIELATEEQGEPHILQASGIDMKIIQYRVSLNKKEIAQEMQYPTQGVPTALIQLSPQYIASSCNDIIEFFDTTSNSNVHTIQTVKKEEGIFENILTLQSMNISSDKNKKYLFASGTNRKIYVYKIDLQLKCASLPIFTMNSSHSNTIVNMNILRQYDQNYLVTISIDKQQGIYKITQPDDKSKGQSLSKFEGHKSQDIAGALKAGIMELTDFNKNKNTACCLIF